MVTDTVVVTVVVTGTTDEKVTVEGPKVTWMVVVLVWSVRVLVVTT